MKWLNSLDELLYEVMSWLLFFPVTLWRATVTPFRVMEEVAAQTTLPDDRQYQSLLSPPLFLALALLFAHALATALGQADAIIANRHGLAQLVDDNSSALVLRVIVFAAFALFLSARLVRLQGLGLARDTLRQPFYEQCYPASVFALALSVGSSLAVLADERARVAGSAMVIAGMLNYAVVETRWFAHSLNHSYLRAAAAVLLALAQGVVFLAFVSFLFTR